MAVYTFQKTVNATRLKLEIIAAALPTPSLTAVGSDLSIYFDNALSAQQESDLSDVVTAHSAVTAEDQVAPIIVSAADYGFQLVRDFGTRNVVAGKTDAEIDSILEDADTLKIGMALISGSLKYARRKVSALTPFAGVTQADKDWLYQKLTDFLGPE